LTDATISTARDFAAMPASLCHQSEHEPPGGRQRPRSQSSSGRLDSDLTLDVRRSINVEAHHNRIGEGGGAERGAARDATPHLSLMGAGPAAVEGFAQDRSNSHRWRQRLDERLVPGGDIHMHFGHRSETIGAPAPLPMLSTSDAETIATRLSCPYLAMTRCSTPDDDHRAISHRSTR